MTRLTAVAAVALGLATGVRAQRPPATAPPLPPGISAHDVEIFGRFANRWSERPGEQMVAYTGDVELHMGDRRLRSRQALIWIIPDTHAGKPYSRLEVFLWRDASAAEPGGTWTAGPALIVTLSTFGKIALNADASSTRPATDEELLRNARAARRVLYERPAATQPAAMSVVEFGPGKTRLTRPRPPRPVTYRGDELEISLVDDRRIVTAIGKVYVSQAGEGPQDLLEMRADAAVLYLSESALRRQIGATTAPASPDLAAPTSLRQVVTGAYLEGDVRLSRGLRRIRASRLYYDFVAQRALILDAVVQQVIPERRVPLYVRARQVRQLTDVEYVAYDAKVSTDEFHTPHYHVGADRIVVTDRTPRDAEGEIIGLVAGDYKMYNTTLNIEGLPVAYWPVTAGTFKQGEASLRRLRLAYSDDFGVSVESKWYLFNILGLDKPEGFDGSLNLDYFSERGPGGGIDLDYIRDDYYGLLRSYLLYDEGEDNLGGDRSSIEPPTETRGRLLLRHRHYLPRDWEVTLELSYLSDDQFLEEWYESEFDNGKEQETLLYLKKQQDNWAFTALAQWRIMNWLTQTERLPDFGFHWLGQPVGDWGAYFSESHLGAVRYRTDRRHVFDHWRFDNTKQTHLTFRGDTRHELVVPFELGPVQLAPFAALRGSGWSNNPNTSDPWNTDDEEDDWIGRFFATYGLRGSLYAQRTYDDVDSRMLDLHRLRHVIKLDAMGWFSHSTTDSSELTPFTSGIETIDDFGGAAVGLRQRWQTQRGGPGHWRSVDWITLDLEAGFFHHTPDGRQDTHGATVWHRPEDSVPYNYLSSDLIYRLSDSTAVLYNGVWDLYSWSSSTQAVSFAVERSPRLSYFLGWRYIGQTDSNLIGGGFNYRINEKHTLAFREFYDLHEGRNFETSITYIRKLPRWYVAITVECDRAEDEFGLSLSAWPEGLPEAAIGSRRFTGLVQDTGLRP